MDINTVKELIQLLKDDNLTVLKIESEDMNVHIERDTTSVRQPDKMIQKENTQKTPAKPADPSKYKEITAPQIGTFYIKKDEHSSEDFIRVGDSIKAGDQIGYIEAMKMFNNLKSDITGIVREIVVSNGEDVEFGEVLVLVEPEDD